MIQFPLQHSLGSNVDSEAAFLQKHVVAIIYSSTNGWPSCRYATTEAMVASIIPTSERSAVYWNPAVVRRLGGVSWTRCSGLAMPTHEIEMAETFVVFPVPERLIKRLLPDDWENLHPVGQLNMESLFWMQSRYDCGLFEIKIDVLRRDEAPQGFKTRTTAICYDGGSYMDACIRNSGSSGRLWTTFPGYIYISTQVGSLQVSQ